MPIPSRTARMLGAIVIAGSLLLSGCSFSFGSESPAEAAEGLIEGEWADQFGLDLTDASCSDPANEDPGTRFPCQATLDGAAFVEFDVLIESEDRIVAQSTNVIFSEQFPAIADAIAGSFADQGIEGLTTESLDCGANIIVLGSERTIVCGLTEPETGEVYDTIIRFTDVVSLTFDFEVAEEPRS